MYKDSYCDVRELITNITPSPIFYLIISFHLTILHNAIAIYASNNERANRIHIARAASSRNSVIRLNLAKGSTLEDWLTRLANGGRSRDGRKYPEILRR